MFHIKVIHGIASSVYPSNKTQHMTTQHTSCYFKFTHLHTTQPLSILYDLVHIHDLVHIEDHIDTHIDTGMQTGFYLSQSQVYNHTMSSVKVLFH